MRHIGIRIGAETEMESPDADADLDRIKTELAEIEAQLRELHSRKRELIELRDRAIDRKHSDASNLLGKRDWENGQFEWSVRVSEVLKTTFKVDAFRARQLSAINATMAKNHAIVVMPTGAGKSLCYQLPAAVEDGLTVVVSPLVSLMEDQVMALKKRNVSAAALSASSSKEDTASMLASMTDPRSPMKLLYVTPERLAKSKRFMAKLQKCFSAGLLRRIAIDEVHCCSQWGHDFRPDYKFLGILAAMFPGVPILGTTATATARVLADVQKMLDIRGCLVIRSTFNRPNLFYRIVSKPSSSEECVDTFEKLLKGRYNGQTGIIYATSVKDCQDLTQGLRNRGLKVACYHASMEPAQRSAVHSKWTDKYYQAVVATVAFGLGIDKPDVRFVLHHSLSKAMESYYQESGRAGRDGQPAECVMMYRMQDVFRLSTMVFSSAGSLEHLYGMVKYCLEPRECRRRTIARHFEEEWDDADCDRMCDRCHADVGRKKIYVEKYCRDLCKIIEHASRQDTKLTAQKLLDSWYGKGATNLRVNSVSPPNLTRVEAEDVIAFLLVEGYLREEFHFTSFSTISYLKAGSKCADLNSENFKIKMILKHFHSLDDISPPWSKSHAKVHRHKEKTCDSDGPSKHKRRKLEKVQNVKEIDSVVIID